ncbi:MAG: hypothetical protein ACK6CT_00115 [Planctomycetia bacterium]|jgi:hypothetical protein
MSRTLGLLHEALQLARDLGYDVREEPLGELAGGSCVVGGSPVIILNIEQPVGERLDRLLGAIAPDPRLEAEPRSRLLDARLAAVRAGAGPARPGGAG